jgi:hypothetical protein
MSIDYAISFHNLLGTEFKVNISTATNRAIYTSTGTILSSSIGDFLEIIVNPLLNLYHGDMVSSINGSSSDRPPYIYDKPQDKLMYFVVSPVYQGVANIFCQSSNIQVYQWFPISENC